jgi:NAD+ synthase (glutamine-hydrolysing)
VLAAPELALTGYPIEDLALRGSFVHASQAPCSNWPDGWREGLGELVVVVGYLDATPESQPRSGRPAGSPQNAAAVLHRGRC